MSFILRATLVIGVLTYLAAQQPDRARITGGHGLPPPMDGVGLAAAWNAIPVAARERVAREGTAELAERIVAMPVSQDTLGIDDRRPAWRGIAGR